MEFFLKLSFALILIVDGLVASECNIEFHHKIFYLEDPASLNYEQVIKSSTCHEEIQKKLVAILSNYNSRLKAKYVENLINEYFPQYNVKISPSSFDYLSFKDIINNQISLAKENKIIKATILNNAEVLTLNQNENLRITCDDCMFPGNKNIKMIISNNLLNKSRFEWINAVVASRVRVLLANENIPVTNRGLIENDFRVDHIYAIRPEIYFSSLSQLPFHRLTQPIAQNSPLKNTDIMPVDLVKTGQAAQVIFEKDGISLSATAIPTRNAKYNETVKLQRDNNRFITGKVIDFNKVKVEL